jgi:SAM-dependent methyltransferase
MSTTKSHWEGVYTAKAPTEVSWFQEHPERSLDLIRRTGLPLDAAIVDVGGGASTLVDDLIAAGYSDLTVLDISASALEAARSRLGPRAARVHWIEADATTHPWPAARFDLWHDRAVFHFLLDDDARRRYVHAAHHAVRPGGHVIVATFGPQGPARCSGLPVARYAPGELHAQFGPAFTLVDHATEDHTTPWGAIQQFVYCYCRTD